MAKSMMDDGLAWPQQRALLVDRIVNRASYVGCRDATILRAVRLLDACDADRLIDTDSATQVADACVAACVERHEPQLLTDDPPADLTLTQVMTRVVADSSESGIEFLEGLFAAAGMDTHGRLFSFAKYLMFLSMCDIDLAGCDVRLLAATAVYITRKTNQKQIAGGIWSAALASEISVSESALESGIATLRMLRLLWGDTQTTKGVVTDAVDEMFASSDRHGVASTDSHPQHQQVSVWWLVLLWMWRFCCRVWRWCCGRPSSDEQQHPLAHLFIDDRCCIPDMDTTLQLRASARCFRDAFSSGQLRTRLDHSMGPDGIDTQLVQFDPSLRVGALMAAVWIAEEGGRWDETEETLQLAEQCRYCRLPVIVTADDINKHANKTTYASFPRVLAQLVMVGRHVQFGDGSRLQLFRHGNQIRAINDRPAFRLTINPPLPAGHLYQQHRLQHDPPVRSHIKYLPRFDIWDGRVDTGEWDVDTSRPSDASVSSFARRMILDHFYHTHLTDDTSTLDSSVGGGRLRDLLTQPPHAPVEGCTTTATATVAVSSIGQWDRRERWLVLTDSSHNFVAWVVITSWDNIDVVRVVTTEAPVGESGAFKDRFPKTTRLARVALGRVAPFVFDGHV
ncbi:unnamed protein product [Vitrella brassicaformis CCMP3155]|uniref:Cyclin C-terminal domain-containing protein n=1 Tax=Vitrella brassicaformis (strain CCMP3155) TaxID=1169540 RepID=A0A0G4GHC5_VITBC|nr:unnamed protein product [Vitrella brassicaformis CCMP3155]|eukprot:CEM29130.1 unnamed protein product [Vitrella brassicaformis CCMP3155]